MGKWDLVEQTPIEQAQTVQKDVPFQPSYGPRNAMTPPSMRVLSTVPARAPSRITYRDASSEEQSKFPGVIQVGSNGAMRFGPRQAAVASGKLSPQDMTYLNARRKEADESTNMASQIDQFVRLNKNVETGGFSSLLNPVTKYFDDPRSVMNGIIDRITPAMRNGLPGAASDRDVAMFRGSTVGMDRGYNANRVIGESAKAMANRFRDHIAFLEAYGKKNGSLLGAQERWNEYTDANPLYEDTLKDNLPVLRKVKPWRSAITDLSSAQPSQSVPVSVGRTSAPVSTAGKGDDPLGLFK